jgi:hypothetical protein
LLCDHGDVAYLVVGAVWAVSLGTSELIGDNKNRIFSMRRPFLAQRVFRINMNNAEQ